jgi:hypothetical protein
MIVDRIEFNSLEKKEDYLPFHKLGLSYTRSGYGAKIPTIHKVKINNRWRRVYCCCYSNSGTCYVETKNKDWIVIY